MPPICCDGVVGTIGLTISLVTRSERREGRKTELGLGFGDMGEMLGDCRGGRRGAGCAGAGLGCVGAGLGRHDRRRRPAIIGEDALLPI